jgi:hypothetical protein
VVPVTMTRSNMSFLSGSVASEAEFALSAERAVSLLPSHFVDFVEISAELGQGIFHVFTVIIPELQGLFMPPVLPHLIVALLFSDLIPGVTLVCDFDFNPLGGHILPLPPG